MAIYNISSLTQLQAMSSHLADDCVLLNDIDASATATWNPVGGAIYLGFEPIGLLAGNKFTGTFDGGGFTISNLYIRRQSLAGSSQYLGMFGYAGFGGVTLITNGTFTGSATGWTLGASWAYGTNNVQKTADGADTLAQITGDMAIALVPGEVYTISYGVSAITGTLTPSCAGVNLTQVSTTGTKTETFTAVDTTGPVFTPSNTSRITLDNITIYKHRYIRNLKLTNITCECDSTSVYGFYQSLLAARLGGTSSERYIIENVAIDGYLRCDARYLGAMGGLSAYATDYDLEDVKITNLTMLNTGAGGWGVGSYGAFGGMIGDSEGGTSVTSSVVGYIQVDGAQYGADKAGIAIGGWVGEQSSVSGDTYNQCYAAVNIYENATSVDEANIGGFVGRCTGAGANYTATDCIATGNILSNTTAQARIGGFSGSSGTCVRCGAQGDIDAPHVLSVGGTYSWIGGFFGYGTSCTDCYSLGDVLRDGFDYPGGTSYIGGFCGGGAVNTKTCYSASYIFPGISKAGGFTGYGVSTATACYWDTEASGYTNESGNGTESGVTGKTTLEMKTLGTYLPVGTGAGEWDFTSVWEFGISEQGAINQSNLTVWPSASGDYDKFEEGTKDADSFQTDIPSTNEIRWIDSQEALLIGTAGDEWELSSNKLGTPLSPTNHGSKRQSGHGSARMQAINVNEVILFVDAVRRKVREMSFDSSKEKYICPDMTSLSEHITAGQVKWTAYQKNPNSILWVGLDTGDVRGFVYDREQNVTAWFKVNLGGNGACQSGCVIPGETEDEIYLVVNRTIAGSFVYAGTEQVYAGDEPVIVGGGDKVYLEKFSARELISKADSFFVDCGITWETSGAYVDQDVYAGTQQVYAGTEPVVMAVFDSTAPSSTITGLSHLEGETVKILADGVVADDAVVTNGEVTIQIAGVTTTAYKAQAGKGFTSILQPMRLVLGDSMGKKTRANGLVLSLQDTGACKYGPDSTDQRDVDLAEIGLTNTSEITGLFTGETEVSQAAGFDSLNPVVITSDAPLPLTVRCIAVDIDRTG